MSSQADTCIHLLYDVVFKNIIGFRVWGGALSLNPPLAG